MIFSEEDLFQLRSVLSKNLFDNEYSCVYHTRFASDFFIGIISSTETAKIIYTRIGTFLATIKLSLDRSNFRIFSALFPRSVFLRTDIQHPRFSKIVRSTKKAFFHYERRIYPELSIKAPFKRVLKELMAHGFCKFRLNSKKRCG
jgi:hypothetical protein